MGVLGELRDPDPINVLLQYNELNYRLNSSYLHALYFLNRIGIYLRGYWHRFFDIASQARSAQNKGPSRKVCLR